MFFAGGDLLQFCEHRVRYGLFFGSGAVLMVQIRPIYSSREAEQARETLPACVLPTLLIPIVLSLPMSRAGSGFRRRIRTG